MEGSGEYNEASDDNNLLSPELVRELRSRARRRHLLKNEMLFRRESPPDAIFCVDRGIIRLSVTAPNGREAVLNTIGPGRWFGELSLLLCEPRIHDARAVVDSEVLILPADAFHEIVYQRPAFLLEFTRLICARYKSALNRMDTSILLPFPVRLAKRLLTAKRPHSANSSGEDKPSIRLSQEELGHILGVSRQSVNKQLKAWEEKKILRLEYGCIILLDADALRRLSEKTMAEDGLV